ncbi:hypothetical protein MetMK1DRAFT_00006540 [Metallosphaera yellowstonensis MK1]|uniref:Uncharacterized protein n=1 Tax=Metallosphaera yellowstonensis MK1 TaxID=671065 RepID=H2C1N1_9CREN|nr:hypothetical protein [Metallosphaera yellowstonensis]EHP70152.1 hypothetical protein MetMK1DRAFT_00006540 [Metallosphaera yellowstonensis MK1]
MSLTEKLIEEISSNPALGEKLRRLLENVVLESLVKEQQELNRNVQAILESQGKIWEEIRDLRKETTELRKDLKELREDFNREITSLREEMRTETARLWEETKKLREDFNREITSLREEMRTETARLWEETKKLREDFNKMLMEIREMKEEGKKRDEKIDSLFKAMLNGFAEMSKFAGMSLEELSRNFLQNYLQGLGVLPKNASLRRKVLDSEEIDIFSENPLIVGEVTGHADSLTELDKLMRKAKLVRERFGAEPRKYLIALTVAREVYPQIKRKAKEMGVELVIGRVVKRKE